MVLVSMGTSKGVFMSLNNGAQSSTYVSATTTTNFSVTSSMNSGSRTYFAYVFAEKEGFSSFGEFEGNSSTNGVYINTGFRPKFVWVKAIDATENWQVRDRVRHDNTGTQTRFYFNSSAAEGSTSTASPIDFLSNGFKIRGSNSEINSSTLIYGAWGDVPFKYVNSF